VIRILFRGRHHCPKFSLSLPKQGSPSICLEQISLKRSTGTPANSVGSTWSVSLWN